MVFPTAPTRAREISAVQAVWTMACLGEDAGALGLFTPVLSEGGEAAHVEGTQVLVPRALLHVWLADPSPATACRHLAMAGLAALEAWLGEPSGWPLLSAGGPRPTAALGAAPQVGQAVRARLRGTAQAAPLDLPVGLSDRWAWWRDPGHGWGHGGALAWSAPGEDWAPTLGEAQAAWRQAQRAERQHRGGFSPEAEEALIYDCLVAHPQELEAWMVQRPPPRAPREALFLLHDPRWIGPLIAAGADPQATYLGSWVVPWAATERPALVLPLLEAGVALGQPGTTVEDVVVRLAMSNTRDANDRRLREHTTAKLRERTSAQPTALPDDAIARVLDAAFLPHNARVEWLARTWPNAVRLDERFPVWTATNGTALPLAHALALAAAVALEKKNANETDTAHRLATLAGLGVDFGLRLADGSSVFHTAVAACNKASTPAMLYVALTPLGAGWEHLNAEGLDPVAAHPVSRRRARNDAAARAQGREPWSEPPLFDLHKIQADLTRRRLDNRWQPAPAGTGRARL